MKDQSPKSFSAVSLTVLILVTLLLFSSSSPLLASSVFQNFLAQLRILGSNNQPSNSVFVDTEGNVGIGKTDPTTELDVEGTITATKFKNANGEELGGSVWTVDGDNIYREEGAVGIGTSSPRGSFEVKQAADATLIVEDGDRANAVQLRFDDENNSPIRAQFKAWNYSFGVREAQDDMLIIEKGDQANAVQLRFDDENNSPIRAQFEAWNYSFKDGDGESRLFINKDGNVGIGKTNPETKLDVEGAVTATKFIADGEELGGGVWTREEEAHVLRSGDEDNIKMSIGDNGNVSIGKWGNVNPLIISHQISGGSIDNIDKLHLKILNNSSARINRKAGIVFQQRTSQASPRVTINSAIYTEKIDADTVRMNLDVHDQTALTIDNTGKVGIGTKTPQFKLDVDGDINTSGRYLVDGEDIAIGGRFGNGDVDGSGYFNQLDILRIINHINGILLTGEEFLRADLNGDGLVDCIDAKILYEVVGFRGTGALVSKSEVIAALPAAVNQCVGFWEENDDQDTVLRKASRRVGIGTKTPDYKLDVDGDINTSGRYLVNGEEAGLKNIILVEKSVCKIRHKSRTNNSPGLTLVATCPSSHPNLLNCTGTPGTGGTIHLYGWDIIPDYSNNKCTLVVQYPFCESQWSQKTARSRVRAACFK